MRKYLLKSCALFLSVLALTTASYTNASAVGAYTVSSQQNNRTDGSPGHEIEDGPGLVAVAVGIVAGAYFIGTYIGEFVYNVSHQDQAIQMALVLDAHESPTDFTQYDR